MSEAVMVARSNAAARAADMGGVVIK